MVWTDLVHAQPSDKPTGQSIEAILEAKARRTPAQRKLSSQLLDAAGVQPSDSVTRQRAPTADVEDEVVTVDIRADVTDVVLARIRALGGTVLSSVPEYRAIRARLSLTALGPLATLDAVQSIQLADRAITNQSVGTGSKVTEGDTAHQADDARDDYDVDGTGIGIGVISDGVRTLADRQASDDLPARVTVLPGQKGGPLSITGLLTGKGGDEGTAMLEIVHDLAPGAELYFAGGGRGEAQMAQNIKDLCAAGADIIVDDIFYFREPVFQDGIVAQAVNDVTADGCFYFSVAGNAGNLNDDTSGVWEGDYDEGTDFEVNSVSVGTAHDFGSGVEENQITEDGLAFVLQWADPLGASANDYDLFLVDADDNVLASSTTTQDGSQDPIEFIDSSGTDYTDNYLVVVKASGAANRYLRLDTIRGQLEVATTGQTARHTAAENAVTVGAVDVRTAAGAGGVFNGTESVRTDSSDGPRRIFFQPDGTPITAGNFSATGGKLLQKPDLVAATCVSTTAPEFSPFCGSSSAAPHAAGIATLMLEAAGGPANVTLTQLRTAMTGAALDIEATGVDINSGAGIVMAPDAVDAVDVAAADRNEAPTIEGTLTVDMLAPGDDATTLSVTSAFTDPDTGDTLTYTTLSTDPDRVTASMSGSMLTVTPLAPGRVPVQVRAVDPDGLSVTRTVTVTVEAGTRDYDTDNDGFIEISNLTQFNAMRYDQDGDGAVDKVADWMSYYATSAFAEGALGMGCPGSCVGYELEADLDFDTNGSGDADAGDDYWDDGAGWFPFPVRFNIKGNGHTIANLFINRPTQAGSIALFGNVWTPVAGHTVGVSGLRLVDVDVTGNVNVGGLSGTLSSSGFITGSSVTGRVQGTEKVGGLVGHNRGAISTSRTSGHVSGTTSVGGLVGRNEESITGSYATGEVTGETAIGGLVGLNWDSIETSYSTSKVTGQEQVGGLVGRNSVFSSITAGYATGRVSGTSRVGGLAGDNLESITASYATGPVSGETLVGGLTGFVNGSVTASYWDTTTSGEETSAGGSGVTTSALHAPTGATSIYQTWNTDHWDFGTTDQYPALKVNIDGQGTATWQEFGYQLRESPALTARVRGTQVDLTWDPVDTSPWDPVPAVTYTIYRHTSTDIEMVAEDVSGPPYTTTGTTDTYQVVAVVGGGESVRSGLVMPDHPPTFPSTEDGTRSVAENTGANVNIGAPVAATDVNDDPLTYSLGGTDADSFTINMSSGQLRTKAALDYETKDRYEVTVSVSDGPADPVTIDVTLTVTDTPGRVTLSSTRPLVGNALTATVADPDSPISVSTWHWERSEEGTTWGLLDGATTMTYTPSADDLGHYLRVTASYTDADGTAKEATSVQIQRVARRGSGGSGGSGGGGSGGGGGGSGGSGGGPPCTEDLHGNTATQATDVALSVVIAGALCPAADVDYFTVTAPGRGLVFVDTTGSMLFWGTLWQNERVLASGPTGRGQDARLGARVEAGTVVVALQGQGGATGEYTAEITFVRGYLENPGPDSFQSGVGVLSGWVCAANQVELEIDARPTQVAAYGTERLDTARACGDTDNGFGLLFNWNLLGDGEHTVVAVVDGVELDRATVTVTTLGVEFLKEVTGTCEVEDFPTLGETVTLVWQQTSQNFVIAGGNLPDGAPPGKTSALTGFLENPGHNSFQSGVRVVSGWVCDADLVEIALGELPRQVAAYGTERLDTLRDCGDTDNGFGLLFNWNLLGDGEHEVTAFVDGVELGRATVWVTTVGEGDEAEFLPGAEGECVVEDFPMLGETVTLEWQQSQQNFVITEVE